MLLYLKFRLILCIFLFFTGWLEPLLDRIAENKSNVVTPVIDVIDDDTLKYQYSSAQSTSVGGFDWNLQVGRSWGEMWRFLLENYGLISGKKRGQKIVL